MSASLSLATLHTTIVQRAKSPFLVRPAETYRYDQLTRDLSGCCGLFDAYCLAPGDRVLIVTVDERAAIVTFIAALLDGLVPAMLTPDTPQARAAAIAETTAPGLVVADARRRTEPWAEDSVSVEARAKGVFGSIRRPKAGFNASIATGGRPPRLPDSPDALAYILFTSGTTSSPKGVMITHRNLFSHLETLSRLFGYDASSRIFNGMVLAHADGLVQGPLLALANGCALIRPDPFSVATLEAWLNSVRALSATHVLSVPTVYALIDRYAAHHDYFDTGCRCLISSAAKLEEPLWRRLEERFGVPMFNHYGLTETVASGLYAGPHPEMGPFGSIGKPIDMEAKVVGPDGNDVAEGETGELWLKGENVFAGYWKSPENADVLTGDGWLRTGDLARKRSDGAYEITGRFKTAIKYGGLLIRPEEVDEVLLAHPSVVEAVTVGLPDPDFGEIPVSAVVLDRQANEDQLVEHCRGFLEPMKLPKRIMVVKAIPRGSAGKPQLAALRALLAPPATKAPADNGIVDAVLQVASLTFRVPVTSLSPSHSPDDVPGWDSFAHIHLILRAEHHFGVRIATSKVAAIGKLADLVEAIEHPE